eukprot:jgi/Ulvmu1/12543/UM090_0030.1
MNSAWAPSVLVSSASLTATAAAAGAQAELSPTSSKVQSNTTHAGTSRFTAASSVKTTRRGGSSNVPSRGFAVAGKSFRAAGGTNHGPCVGLLTAESIGTINTAVSVPRAGSKCLKSPPQCSAQASAGITPMRAATRRPFQADQAAKPTVRSDQHPSVNVGVSGPLPSAGAAVIDASLAGDPCSAPALAHTQASPFADGHQRRPQVQPVMVPKIPTEAPRIPNVAAVGAKSSHLQLRQPLVSCSTGHGQTCQQAPAQQRATRKPGLHRLGANPAKLPLRATLADAEISPARPGRARKFLLERLRTHLKAAAAAAAEAWADGLAQYERDAAADEPGRSSAASNRVVNQFSSAAAGTGLGGAEAACKQVSLTGQAGLGKAGLGKAGVPGLQARDGGGRTRAAHRGDEAASATSLAKQLWVAEHVLSVETQWQRKHMQHQQAASAADAIRNLRGDARMDQGTAASPKAARDDRSSDVFDLSGVYSALGSTTAGGHAAAPPHAATQRIHFLARSVMAALDGFAGSERGFPLSLPALPPGAAALLQTAAAERLQVFATAGQRVSHLALESHCLTVLDAEAAEAAIAAVAAQVPYPCNSVVPGMIKMNMARFVFWHEVKAWRFVLKEDWMSAATQLGAILHGQQLSPMEVMGILSTAYDISGLAERDIDAEVTSDHSAFQLDLWELQRQMVFGESATRKDARREMWMLNESDCEADEAGGDDGGAAGRAAPEAAAAEGGGSGGGGGEELSAAGSTACVALAPPHSALVGTVFYDEFKDTGHTIERRRSPEGHVIEELRDMHGALLAIALPEWDPIMETYVRKVHRLDNAVCAKVKTSQPWHRRPKNTEPLHSGCLSGHAGNLDSPTAAADPPVDTILQPSGRNPHAGPSGAATHHNSTAQNSSTASGSPGQPQAMGDSAAGAAFPVNRSGFAVPAGVMQEGAVLAAASEGSHGLVAGGGPGSDEDTSPVASAADCAADGPENDSGGCDQPGTELLEHTVFYLPDGAGGFIEIVDAGSEAGVCTVAPLSPDAISHMLTPGGPLPAESAPGVQLHSVDDHPGRGSQDGGRPASGIAAAGCGRSLFFTDGAPADMLHGCGTAS